jgi:putative hemolysin
MESPMKYPMIVALALTLAACTTQEAPTQSMPASSSTATKTALGLANPASVNCGKQGGRVDLRRDDKGNVDVELPGSSGHAAGEFDGLLRTRPD